jgi:predicted nucleic acid-binding protein
VKGSTIRYLVDAGPLIAFLSARDQWHGWAVQTMSVIDEPVGSSELALAETCHRLKSDRTGLRRLVAFIATGRILPLTPWPVAVRMDSLLEKYSIMDAGDASLVVLSELFPKAKIITTDVRQFTVYRRFANESLPLIHP